MRGDWTCQGPAAGGSKASSNSWKKAMKQDGLGWQGEVWSKVKLGWGWNKAYSIDLIKSHPKCNRKPTKNLRKSENKDADAVCVYVCVVCVSEGTITIDLY